MRQQDIALITVNILTLPIGGFIVLIVFLGTPKGAKKINQSLNIVGLVNHAGQSPLLLKRYKEYGVTIMEFDPNGISLSDWEDKHEDIETALNMHVENIRYGKSRDKIVLQAISGNENLPDVVHWKDKFLSDEDYTLILGQSMTGQIRNNIDFRVCGRADNILSQIILDNTEAADKIPKESQGLFITHDGVIFKGYLFDEKAVFIH